MSFSGRWHITVLTLDGELLILEESMRMNMSICRIETL
jgi:hypothetical protein